MSYYLVFHALQNPTRRAIISALGSYYQTVGELHQYLLSREPLAGGAKKSRTTRAAISQHLQVLLKAQLVAFTEDDSQHVYRLDPPGFDEIRVYLDGIEKLPDFFR